MVDLLTFDELFDLLEENPDIDFRVKKACKNIIDAERDMTASFESISDFIRKIEFFVGGKTTKENVSLRLKHFERNLPGNIWETEAFTSLIEVFEYNDKMNLTQIFTEISEDFKSKKTIC